MRQNEYIPHVQVRSKALILYDLPALPPTYTRHSLNQLPTYTGKVTDHAVKRIKRTVDVFLQLTPTRKIYNPVIEKEHWFKLSFCTLTISQAQPVKASEGHKALKIFLQHFRRQPAKKAISEQLRNYIWKAELQERGQLHYHLTCDAFLHWAEVKRVWNGIQYNRGWLNEYQQQHGHTNANSTDIHSVYKVRDIQAYLSKYLSKQEFKDLSEMGYPCPVYSPCLDAKVWDCSNGLKRKRFADELDTDTENRILDAIESGDARVKKLERCAYVETDYPYQLLSNKIYQNYQNWKK